MAKLNWQRNHSRYLGNMNSDYWTNPKEGFDKSWHTYQNPQTYNSESIINRFQYGKQTQNPNYKKGALNEQQKSAIEQARQKLGYK